MQKLFNKLLEKRKIYLSKKIIDYNNFIIYKLVSFIHVIWNP